MALNKDDVWVPILVSEYRVLKKRVRVLMYYHDHGS